MEPSTTALIISKDDIWKNPNTDYEIPIEVQKRFMNGNAQFLLDMAVHLKVSYTITSMAIHFCHYFFYKRKYINYDRFLVATSCLLLSLKLKDTEGAKMRSVCNGYHKIIAKVENRDKIEIMDEEVFNKIKEKIIVYESKLLKVVGFTLDLTFPYPYVERIVTRYFRDDKEKDKQLYHLSRVFILDSYRTYACLVHRASILAISGVVIAANTLGYQIPPNMKDVKVNPEEMTEEAYKSVVDGYFDKWVAEIDPEAKPADVAECLKIFYEMLETYHEMAGN